MWIVEKSQSFVTRVRTKAYARSEEWRNNPLNPKHVSLPADDWVVVNEQLRREAASTGFEFNDFEVEIDDYNEFKRLTNVSSFYALGYRDKKILEHFIAHELLGLKAGHVYLDVASEASPFPAVFRHIFGVVAYSQDLTYNPGVHGHRIGSDAAAIPLPDGTVDGVSLQCAFEHFEGDCDSRFIGEVSRLLRPGGACVIVPLYVGLAHLNIFDPVLHSGPFVQDANATMIGELDLGGSFERIYSPAALERIIRPDLDVKYTLYRVRGVQQINADRKHPVHRVRYALLIRKPHASNVSVSTRSERAASA